MKFSTISFSRILLAALFTVLSTLGLRAQVSGYTFSESVGTYTEITGGTALVTCSGCPTTYDTDIYGVTLPSSFPYNGSNISAVTMVVDGSLVLGTTTGLSSTGPISSTQTANGIIAGLGMDLRNTTLASQTYELRWEDVGTEFVFQWKNASRWAQNTVERFSFQIRITKASGLINIVYGNMTTIAASTFYVPQVGLRGSSNTDFNARRLTAAIPDATPNWGAPNGTTAATANSHTVRFTGTSTVVPSSGLTFTWTPPTPCSPVYSTTYPYTESFESWGSCGGGTTNVPTTNWLNTPASGNNSWRRNDQGASAVWSSTTGAYSPVFTVGSFSARFHSYDASAGTQGNLDFYLNCSAGTTAKRVSFDHINTSGTDVLAVFVSTTGPGGTFTQIGTNIGTSATWTNRFFDFTSSSATTVIRLRATSDFGTTDIGVDNFQVANQPTCAAPTALSGTPTSATAANLAWTAPGSPPSGGYEWEVRTSGLGGSGLTGLTAFGTTGAGVTTASTSLLTAANTYTLYVRSFCGGSDYSTWAASATFVTPCASITSIPYTEGFDAATNPVCWTPSLVSGTINWAPVTTNDGVPAPRTGTRFAGKGWTSGANQDALIASPPFNFSSIPTTETQVNVWIYRNTVNGLATDRTTFYVNTTPNLSGSPLQLIDISLRAAEVPVVAASGWYNYTANIPLSYNTGGNFYIIARGRGTTSFSSYSVGFDDFVVEAAPTCFPPTGLSAVATSATSANLSWVAPLTGTPVDYNWEVRTSGLPGTGGAIASGTIATLAATTSALTANTNYSFYVRTSCTGPISTSAWAGPFNFVTPCVAVNVTYTQDFNSTTTPAIPACNSRENTNGDASTWLTATAASIGVPAVTSQALIYPWNPDLITPANDWFFTQGINFTAGTQYRLRFKYLCQDPVFVEALRVRLSTSQNSGSVLGGAPLFENSNVNLNTYTTASIIFTVPSDGVYFVGFQAFSAADKALLVLDDIIVDLAPTLDMSATALVSPSGCVNASSAVTIRVKNNGGATINFATNNVGVNVNATGPNPATLSTTLSSGTLASGATLDVVVDAAFNTSAVGTYTFAASTALIGGDGDVSNDAMTPASVTRTLPVALPQTANFTGFTGANLTTVSPNWREAEGPVIPVGTTSNWLNRTLGGGTTAAVNLSNIFTTSWMIGPKFTAAACSEVKFRAAITDFASSSPDPAGMTGTDDKVEVMISTDCGLSWSPIYTFNSANQPTSTLTNYSVNLSAYNGQDIIVAFKATDGPIDNTPDYDFHIDDINIQNKPAIDAGVIALIAPVGPALCGTANQTVTVRLKNFGCSTLTSIPVSVNVTGANPQTLTATYSGSLAPNAEVNFNVGTLDMTTGGLYTFPPTTTLLGDGDATNNASTPVVIGTLNPTSLTITPSLASVCSPTPFSLTAVATGTPQIVLSGTSGAVNLAIPDNTPAGVTSTITISGGPAATLTATDVIRVTLNINHVFLADVDVYLVDPSGTRAMELTTDNGPFGVGSYTNTQLVTGATPSITTGSSPFTGLFGPEGNLSTGLTFNAIAYTALVGSSYNGAWRLVVVDDAGTDVGTLVSWSLEITAPTNYTHTFSGPGTVGATSYSGLFNSTGTAGVTTAPVGTNTYTVTTTGTNGCVTTRTTSVTVSNCPANTWQGDVISDETNWFNAGNWSGNVVPTCGTPAIIPTSPSGGAFFPVISGANATVGNITVQNSAKIDIANNQTLSVCGNFVGGTSTNANIGGPGKVVLVQSAGLQTVSGRVKFETLRVENTGSGTSEITGGNTQINTALELRSGNMKVTNATFLTFLSNSATHSAVLDNFSSGFTGTFMNGLTPSVARAQRSYNAQGNTLNFNFHHTSSPFNNLPTIKFGANGTPGYLVNTACSSIQSTQGSPYGNVQLFDEASPTATACWLQSWKTITAATQPTLVNGQGYAVRRNGAGTLTVDGSFNINSTYTLNGLTNSNWSGTTAPPYNVSATSGSHMLGNPYLAYLDLSKSSGANHNANAGFTAFVYVWNIGTASFDVYDPSTDLTVIPPFGTFWVKKTAGAPANYTINGNDRTRTETATFNKQNIDHVLNITAVNTATGLLDKTRVSFSMDAEAAYQPQTDAEKMLGAYDRHSLYTNIGNLLMARNMHKSVEETSTIPMGFYVGATGSYELSFDGINTFDPTSYVYVEDKTTGTMHNVRNGNYSFTANITDAQDRFVLHFTPKAEIQAADATCQNNGQITIEQPGAANWNYTITDNATNATMAQGTLNSSNPVAVAAPSGVYNITLTDNNGYQVIKNVQVNGQTPIAATMTANTNTAEVDETITLNNTTTGATNQTWDMGNSVQFSTPMVNYSYPAEGVYTVTLSTINADGCAATTTQTITVTQKTATSLNNLTKDKLKVWSYENKVMVDFTKQPGDAVVIIYNLLGQEISNEPYTGNGIYSKELNNNELGYILIKVRQGDKITTKKLFISQL